jgi:hypothetical protein
MTEAASTPEIQSTGSTDLAPRLGQWLEDYSEIAAILPVLAGLIATSRLQLRGAQALLVNLLIAALVRQVVLQLKQQAQPPNASAIAPTNASGNHDTASQTTAEDDYTIVHSVPGRIRLRIPRLASDTLYARRLEKLLAADERVKHVRINRAAASLIIQYDGTGVSEVELGMYLLNILDQAEATIPESAPSDSTEPTL